MSTNSETPIPSWLETPPSSVVNPPVKTRVQELPFGELAWKDFEKLCLRLVRLEADVEHCQLYGTEGQSQEGIDIYARLKSSSKYRVYQCKRVNKFGPAKIKKAVTKFLEGEWADKTETFVLCTKESLEKTDRAKELENQNDRLKEKGITLLPWDSHQLSMKLKDLPKLVDDFFRREWVKAFCGEEEAAKLGTRLDVKDVVEFRKRLVAFYQHVFNMHDPGLPSPSLGEVSVLPLEDRYVLPDIYDWHSIPIPYFTEDSEPEISEHEVRNSFFEDSTFKHERRTVRTQRTSEVYRQRQPIERWLFKADHNIILGDPGSGKSTILRFVAIDLLQESPHLTILSQKWGQFLPVWIPFALWTKIISAETMTPCSLSDLLYKWLKSWNEEQFHPLVERALEDERLLLLVDGLDEWTNESAAHIALDRLKVFIEQRNVPAILTSRPHGFERLGMQQTGWQLGELSDFSIAQQEQLSQIWFAHKIRRLNREHSYEADGIEQKAHAEVESFLSEIQSSIDFRELAKVPLLLGVLISHKFHNARLPQSRFKAYDSLIEHFIFTHPRKRKRAASLSEEPFELTDEDIKDILAHLAHYIQEHFGEGLIDHDKAVALVEDYLQDWSHGFGFERREARRYSREVLEVGENTIGLIVEWSPQEIGFFHRVFKEYLAAYSISRLPLTEQLSIIETQCTNPQWREVILGLFHITNRPEDIKQFVECITKKSESENVVDRYHIDLLLTETAFGDFNCSVGLARELARNAFQQIELGSWIPHRERLLHHALDGLRSTKVKELVKSKLKSWFPCRTKWREHIFNAMANWPRTPEVVECLWKGMHDEEPNNQRAAARALADLVKNDVEIGKRIASLAYNAVDPIIRTVAIEALLRGWREHEEIDRILEAARHSISLELRLISIIGRIQKHCQSEKDREELIRLGSWATGVGYSWRNNVILAFLTGWPKSSQTKDTCLKALGEKIQERQRIDKGLALEILLEGYPQDQDVALFCVNQIKHEKFPFIGIEYLKGWHLLYQNFKDYPELVEALDEWMSKQVSREPEAAMAALVGHTPKAKAQLLSSISSSLSHWSHWSAWALLEGWGIKDVDVAEQLTQIAFGSPAKASQIAHLLPQIIEDKTTCRGRLLELLQNPKCKRLDFVMGGLKNLGNTQGDTEVVDIIVDSVLKHSDQAFHEDIIGPLIAGYSSDKRVKELAKQELLKRDGDCIAVAWAYGDDEEIRRKIIEMACPLPASLRQVIATRLREGISDNTFAISTLKYYDFEKDETAKTQASISYYSRLKETDFDTTSAVETLSQDIVCYGFDLDERRQAAFCGLVTLDRLDVMVHAKEQGENDKSCTISLFDHWGDSPNIPLLRYILQNWDAIKTAFGDGFWRRFFRDRPTPLGFWNELCLLAEEYPSPRQEALRFLEERPERTAPPNILGFLGRTAPKSQLLLEYCLKALSLRSDNRDYSREKVVAAELLGIHFGGDSEVLMQLISEHSKKTFDENLILALCEGWPESEELEYIFERACKHKPQLSYPVYFRLISRKSSSDIVFDTFIEALSYSHSYADYSFRRSLQFIIRPILRRLQNDDEFLTMLLKRLQDNPTSSEKATIPRLISAGRGTPSKLRTWCIEEINQQLSGTKSPEIGFDLIFGNTRPIVHSLLDVLVQPTWRDL